MSAQTEGTPFSTKQRETLFVRLAKRPGGVAAQEVFDEGTKLGDRVTIEAYHNLGRRLVHRGVLTADKSERQTRFETRVNGEGQWLDEEQLASIVDPEYPLIALTVLQESRRQLNTVPERVWAEIRERLKTADARQTFVEAISGYCQNLRDEIENYAIEQGHSEQSRELPRLKQKIQNEIVILRGLAKFGLGLSKSAVQLPTGFDAAMDDWKARGNDLHFFDAGELEREIAQRVEAGPFIKLVEDSIDGADLLIAAVDGSTRSGLLSPEGEQGDFTVGSYPLVSINTAVGQVNKAIKMNSVNSPAFMRLPEKPEDMQQSDNRHTIMAKMFYPDITDGEYIHSVWNAMDVLESKATLRVMRRWYTSKTNIEIRPADVVLRDGTVVPQERDFSHYIQRDSYGRIARDLIEVNWEVVKKCRDEDQTVAGIVKQANLRVFVPVINWYICRLVGQGVETQIESWPLPTMNLLKDQVMLSRLLTAQRKKGDAWTRTCTVLRPFHAVTKFAEAYSKRPGEKPAELILKRARKVSVEAELDFGRDDSWLKSSEFRGERDAYVQMLQNCWYASNYIGAVPRLDLNNVLPRCEFILPTSTESSPEFPQDQVARHLARLVSALKSVGFDVSADHSMFQNQLKIDILPSLLIRVHETVKVWAAELASRVNEYIGFYVSRHVVAGSKRGVRVRPWTAAELEAFAKQLQNERNLQAGTSGNKELSD